MLSVIGIAVTVLMVLGGYTLGGGSVWVVLQALPFELSIIGGAAIGSFLLSNKTHVVKKAITDFALCFKEVKWQANDYKDLLTLLYAIMRLVRAKGTLSLESHLEDPAKSDIFTKYPNILRDQDMCSFICDTFRVISMNLDDPYQIEEIMEKRLKKIEHELMASPSALQVAADGLPALGIVAAVLGVIKTMASVDKPPLILGAMIGGALVGTFLGVFLAYCLVGPIAQKSKAIYEQDMHAYLIVRDVIVAFLRRNPPQIAVEIGRSNIPTCYQPTFAALEAELEKRQEDGGSGMSAVMQSAESS